jgi:peptide chain release factor 2
MVKDLRTEIETSDVTGVLDGNIDEFVEGYLRMRRAQDTAAD